MIYKIVTLSLLISGYIVLFAELLMLRLPYFVNALNFINLWILISLILIAIFTSAGFYSNLSKIPFIVSARKHIFPRILSCTIFIGSLICLAVAFCFPNMQINILPSWEHYFICSVVVLLCLIILPIAAGRALLRTSEVYNTQAEGISVSYIGHDGVLISLIAIICILTPLLVVSFFISINIGELLDKLLKVFAIIAGIYFPLTLCLENNSKLLKEQINKFKDEKEKQVMLHELSIHLIRQNILVSIILLPLSLMLFILEFIIIYVEQQVVIINERLKDSAAKRAISRLKNKYLPILYKSNLKM